MILYCWLIVFPLYEPRKDQAMENHILGLSEFPWNGVNYAVIKRETKETNKKTLNHFQPRLTIYGRAITQNQGVNVNNHIDNRNYGIQADGYSSIRDVYIENNEEQQLSKKLEDFLTSNVQSNEAEKAILAFLNAIKNRHARVRRRILL